MKLHGEQILLRIYLRNTDKCGWVSASDCLVQRARQKHLSGATVLRGIHGLDCTGQVLQSGRWSLVEHVPVIIEIIDSAEAILRFLDDVREIVPEGLATLERAHVLVYRQNRDAAERAAMHSELPPAVPDLSTLPSPEACPAMKMSEEGQLVRIFIGESDLWEGQPLYRAIVLKAKELDLAGATVLRGPMGFGANSRVHTTSLLELSTDLPLIIEIVDSAANLQKLLPFLDEVVGEGLITIEAVRVFRYRHNEGKQRL